MPRSHNPSRPQNGRPVSKERQDSRAVRAQKHDRQERVFEARTREAQYS